MMRRPLVAVLLLVGLAGTTLGVAGLLQHRGGSGVEATRSAATSTVGRAGMDSAASGSSPRPTAPGTVPSSTPSRTLTPTAAGSRAAVGPTVGAGETMASSPAGVAPAVARAEDFVAAYARVPASQAGAWQARVRPFLTEQAVSDYAGVDPSRVPFTSVTGPAGPVVGEGGAVAPAGWVLVAVPTDAGVYLVQLQAAAPYAVARLTRAEQ